MEEQRDQEQEEQERQKPQADHRDGKSEAHPCASYGLLGYRHKWSEMFRRFITQPDGLRRLLLIQKCKRCGELRIRKIIHSSGAPLNQQGKSARNTMVAFRRNRGR